MPLILIRASSAKQLKDLRKQSSPELDQWPAMQVDFFDRDSVTSEQLSVTLLPSAHGVSAVQ